MTNLVWHIHRAKFVFDDTNEYEAWKKTKTVRFEMDPTMSDDGGDEILADPENSAIDIEVTDDVGKVSVSLEEDGPAITAWVKWSPSLADGVSEDEVIEWGDDMGGWAAGSIYLGEYDATITEDDGGGIRALEE